VPEIWTNWAADQRCAPARLERPRSEEDVRRTVTAARETGATVKVAGSGHSFTDIACTDGYLLDLRDLMGIVDADAASGLVRVRAGTTLYDLGRALAERGLAMENQGDIDRQTLAGSLATATHGTGARFANLSSQVRAMRLVGAEGEPLDLDDPETLRAARVGLGALGVVTEVTLQTVPLFSIRRVDEPRPLGEVLDGAQELADRHDHFEFYVFPYSDVAIVRESQRTDAPPIPVSRRRLYLQEAVIENAVVGLGARLGRALPGLVPRVNRTFSRLVSRNVRTDRSFRVYASRREVRFTEMEYALPREHVVVATRRVLDLVERRRLPVGFPLEVRFSAADDAYLSTASGRDTGYVAVHQYRGVEFESYFRAVEAIMDEYGGRPHWGKRHYQSAATLASRYPDWDRFQAVRARLDPEGVFANDYTRRVLGPVTAPVGAASRA
jgi:FAD-linked oxidoreductase